MKQVSSLGVGKGFKKTEIGDIPADWEVARLGDISNINMGISPSSKNCFKFENGIPFFQGKAEFDYKYPKAIRWCNSAIKTADKDDILISVRAPVGDVNICPSYSCIGRGLASIRGTSSNTGFLYFYLSYITQYFSRIEQGSTFGAIQKNNLFSLNVPFPPINEQRKIRDILSIVDDAFLKLSEVIEKTKQLKKGMMRRLLTQGIGHTKFQTGEIGRLPSEWEVVRVLDVCAKPEYGYTASASSVQVGPKFLRITDIQNGQVRWEDVPYCSCQEDVRKKYSLKEGDIVFTRTGASTGKSFLISKCPDAVFASYLIRISARDIDPLFLYLFFQSSSYWIQVEQLMVGSAQGGLNATELSRIKLPLPAVSEQRSITSILISIDDELNLALNYRAKLGELKKALMRVLLTGKVRVKV